MQPYCVQAMTVYAYHFVDTPWIKVGYAKDALTRAADGWWECSHPQECCYKLDIRHVTLLGVWEMTKQDEQKLHAHFHGEKLQRHSHNEFYTVYDWRIINAYLAQYPSKETDAIHPPMEIPKPQFYKKRDPCCGGTALFCAACQRPIKKEWKRHLGTAMHIRNTQ